MRSTIQHLLTALALTLPLTGAMAQCVHPPAGLVAWWRAKGNALDRAGSHHGYLTNGAAFGPGQLGQAFKFSGPFARVQVPGSRVGALDITNEHLTVAAWIHLATRSLTGSPLRYSRLNFQLSATAVVLLWLTITCVGQQIIVSWPFIPAPYQTNGPNLQFMKSSPTGHKFDRLYKP